jgi:hypothetical protein
MEPCAETGKADPERAIHETAIETLFAEDKKSDPLSDPSDEKKHGFQVNEKDLGSAIPTSDSEENSVYVYEKDNMARDDTGRIVVETSELAITALHVDDDPTLSPWTFRTFFLGMYVASLSTEQCSRQTGSGLACFGSVLATIYMFKPQSVSVSVIFLALISYVLGEAIALFIPRKGILKWLNPFPFNQKEHVAILISKSYPKIMHPFHC